MRAHTEQIEIKASPEETFTYVANPLNLPSWAVEFARRVEPDGDRWIVTTAAGPELAAEVALTLRTDEELGVVDFLMSPEPGVVVPAATRVIDAGECSVYVFTVFQSEAMPEELFEAQIAAVARELDTLKLRLEGPR